MWEAGQVKEVSVPCLKGANVLARIGTVMWEIRLQNQLPEDDIQADKQELQGHRHPT